jgi:hypothetical protein
MDTVKYELVESKNAFHNDHWCVKIMDGDFAGLVYQYDVIRIGEQTNDEGETEISFNTITVENPNNVDLTEEVEKGIMGEILIDIMTKQMEAIDENGTPNT